LKAANNPEQDYTLKIGANGREMGVGVGFPRCNMAQTKYAGPLN